MRRILCLLVAILACLPMTALTAAAPAHLEPVLVATLAAPFFNPDVYATCYAEPCLRESRADVANGTLSSALGVSSHGHHGTGYTGAGFSGWLQIPESWTGFLFEFDYSLEGLATVAGDDGIAYASASTWAHVFHRDCYECFTGFDIQVVAASDCECLPSPSRVEPHRKTLTVEMFPQGGGPVPAGDVLIITTLNTGADARDDLTLLGPWPTQLGPRPDLQAGPTANVSASLTLHEVRVLEIMSKSVPNGQLKKPIRMDLEAPFAFADHWISGCPSDDCPQAEANATTGVLRARSQDHEGLTFVPSNQSWLDMRAASSIHLPYAAKSIHVTARIRLDYARAFQEEPGSDSHATLRGFAYGGSSECWYSCSTGKSLQLVSVGDCDTCVAPTEAGPQELLFEFDIVNTDGGVIPPGRFEVGYGFSGTTRHETFEVRNDRILLSDAILELSAQVLGADIVIQPAPWPPI